MSYLGQDEYGYNDYSYNSGGSNSFKTIFRGEAKSFHSNVHSASGETVKHPTIDINKEEDFPTLGKPSTRVTVPTLSPVPTQPVEPIAVVQSAPPSNNYKSAIAKQVITEVEYVEVIPPGWVKYTFNKTTKRIAEKKGEEVESRVERPLTKEEEDEAAHQRLMLMLHKNRERHRKSFIACHGEEYYNDQFFIKHSYGETDSSSDASDYEQ
jgi:hypothetical protein